jgi:hypothetical protein
MSTVKEVWEMACPKCGQDDQLDIVVTLFARLLPNGTDPDQAGDENGDHEWDENSTCACRHCGWCGIVEDLHHGTEIDVAAERIRAASPYMLKAITYSTPTWLDKTIEEQAAYYNTTPEKLSRIMTDLAQYCEDNQEPQGQP